ncbi:MAG: transposase [Caldilineaceae bacterium]|nr:transposase [Caldilineaceae bacterium]
MSKKRKFKRADYEATAKTQITLGEALPEDHLARFVARIIGLLDLSEIYAKYGDRGGMPYAPEVLLGLLLYGYATGTFSSRKLEKATYESIPYRYLAGNMHPDHDTINQFRKENLVTLKGLFVQVLVLAYILGHVRLGNISIDGSKLHADASKSKAVSYGRILVLEKRLQQEIDELFALAEQADSAPPDDFDIDDEIGRRTKKLADLAQAKAVLEAMAQQRHVEEQAEYERKLAERQAQEAQTGKKTPGRPLEPPPPGPRDKDQYNFTDPESRIMKNGNSQGFEQAYNAQAAVEHESRLIVGNTLSNHPNDKQEGAATAQAIPSQLGIPQAAALDAGYFSAETIAALDAMGIDPYIAVTREHHHPDWRTLWAGEPGPPPEGAGHKVKMLYKLRIEAGKAIYRVRKSTVEPVFGIIKEVMGFRQFSVRGLTAAAGEWNLVCLAYNLKRLHILHTA